MQKSYKHVANVDVLLTDSQMDGQTYVIIIGHLPSGGPLKAVCFIIFVCLQMKSICEPAYIVRGIRQNNRVQILPRAVKIAVMAHIVSVIKYCKR